MTADVRRSEPETSIDGAEIDIGAPVFAFGGLVFLGAAVVGRRLGATLGFGVGVAGLAVAVDVGVVDGDGLGGGDVVVAEDDAAASFVRVSSTAVPQAWVSSVKPVSVSAMPTVATLRLGPERRAVPDGTARFSECLPMACASAHQGLSDQC